VKTKSEKLPLITWSLHLLILIKDVKVSQGLTFNIAIYFERRIAILKEKNINKLKDFDSIMVKEYINQ
jgi:hypothetical protein